MGGPGSGVGSRGHAGPITQRETMARLHALSPKAMQVLTQALNDGDVQVALRVVEYVVGRPLQRTEVTGADGGPVQLYAALLTLTPSQLVERLDALRAEAQRLAGTGDTPGPHPALQAPNRPTKPDAKPHVVSSVQEHTPNVAQTYTK